jgi:hypothetical protein
MLSSARLRRASRGFGMIPAPMMNSTTSISQRRRDSSMITKAADGVECFLGIRAHLNKLVFSSLITSLAAPRDPYERGTRSEFRGWGRQIFRNSHLVVFVKENHCTCGDNSF